jgi:tetratricopeptide (TPR) repeat protein
MKKKNRNIMDRCVILVEINITFEPLPNKYIKKLPRKVQKKIHDIYYAIYNEPEKAIVRIKSLLKKYPDVPNLYNHLAVAYSELGDIENVDKTVSKSYKKHPDYIFAKIAFAESCIRNDEIDMIPVIFNRHYDLKSLYPDRDTFHVTEFVAFTYLMGRYFEIIGKHKTANLYLDMLTEIVPDHPATEALEEFLNPNLRDRIQRFIDRKQKEAEKRK